MPTYPGDEWWTWAHQWSPCRLFGTMLWSTDGFCRIEEQLCKSIKRSASSEPSISIRLRQRGFVKLERGYAQMVWCRKDSSSYGQAFVFSHQMSCKTYLASKLRVHGINCAANMQLLRTNYESSSHSRPGHACDPKELKIDLAIQLLHSTNIFYWFTLC